jgi:hypothetical protein
MHTCDYAIVKYCYGSDEYDKILVSNIQYLT